MADWDTMSDPFSAPVVVVTNEGFDDETGLLSYVLTDGERKEIGRAVEIKRKNPLLMRIAPPIEPKPFHFELLLSTGAGMPLLRIEKRQRFPQRVWASVSEPAGPVIGVLTAPAFPWRSWDYKIKDAGGTETARIERVHRRHFPYTCVQDGTEIAQVDATRGWQTKVRGTRDFFNRFGNEYTVQISGEARGPLRTLLAVFPIIGDLSRNEMANQVIRP
ncbi:hypothetical protein GCM10009735_45990 [Actinomadura chokoriensis]